MDYIETRTNIKDFKWKYTCEDVFGKAKIYSIDKLSPEILDEIVLDNIIAKQVKKGHTDKIEFEAEFKNPWEEIKEDEKYLDISELPLNQQECCKEKEGELNKELNKVNYYKLTLVILTIISFFVIMTLVL